MTAQWDLSRILQRKLERYLAGLAITYPIYALEAFRKLEEIMLDPIAVGWLQYLSRRKRDLLALDDERKILLTFALSCGFECGKHHLELIDELNQTSQEYDPLSINEGEMVWSHYSPLYLISETEQRIREQYIFRDGLEDLTLFTVGYLERRG